MACFSTSLEDVVKKSDEARIQVDNLQKGLLKSDMANKDVFDEKRAEFFKNAGLDDVANGEVNNNIKVEFASEFSLDKVIPVVQAAIKTAVAVYAVGTLIGDNTQKAFSDLVVAMGECAKFSSSASASMSFATNRLSPGLFVSLYAASATIEDSNMFGKKAVTATMYYYQISKSNKDIDFDTARDLTLLYAEQVIKLNRKLLLLADQVADGTVTLEAFKERRAAIQALINEMRPVLATYKNEKPEYKQLVKEMVETEKKSVDLKTSKTMVSKGAIDEKSIDLAQLLSEFHETLASF